MSIDGGDITFAVLNRHLTTKKQREVFDQYYVEHEFLYQMKRSCGTKAARLYSFETSDKIAECYKWLENKEEYSSG
ncbi:MAG: hypothetical protein VXU43_02980 [Pseudomonadota bacterium]|nr:hypothetical protein [Pseudomonadota bacterium]|tara:strand:+ start:1954 stop:2181 length:228 start_codon:yes stop_codon:yes gene_type:complete